MAEPIDPFANPVLCPTKAGTTRGARFGCSRTGDTQWHAGTDLKANVGTPFAAIYSGTVLKIRKLLPTDVNYKKELGQWIIVKSTGFSIKYCHLDGISVEEGDDVDSGDIIGTTGKSGNAFSDVEVPVKHLHIVVSTDNFATDQNYVDPEPYLKTKYPPANPAISQDEDACGGE
jgi:murein DD-endopeptidase MepM/ murein hydrolase activator NlpD